MTRRITRGLILASLALALAACKPAAEPAADAAPADAADSVQDDTAKAAVAGTDATAVVHNAPSDPAGFDRKAFAGTFAGTLPCADCPGIDTRLDIAADGTFTLSETYQDRDTTSEARGTWTIDAAGKQLLLDPETKDGTDRHFELVSKDELRALDTAGEPIDSTHNLSLRRG